MSWRSSILILFLSAALHVRSDAAGAVSWRPLEVAGAESTRAVALNDSGTVLGVAEFADGSRPVLWRNGSVIVLNDIGNRVTPLALNNRDEVAGSVRFEKIYRPWLYANGVEHILGPMPELAEDDAARAINDNGVVVGNVGRIGYVLAPEEQFFPEPGGGPCWSGATRLIGIDNSGAVIGEVDGATYRWRSYKDPSAYEYLPLQAVTVHGSNVAGSVFGVPAVLRGTNLTLLTAPGNSGIVNAINDAGIMVGQGGDSSVALIWNGTTGVDLGSLIELPEGSRLLAAAGINRSGQIAGTFENGRRSVAILIDGSVTNALPADNAITIPAKALFTNSLVQVHSGFKEETNIVEVFYIVQQGAAVPANGAPPCGWTPPSINWTTVATNIVRRPPFDLELTNVAPGQYSFYFSLRDRNGVIRYSSRGYFAVAGRPNVRIQKNWWNEIEVGMDGAPGYLEELEVSSDLLRWQPLTNAVPAEQIVHREKTSEWGKSRARFYRAKAVQNSIDSWGGTALLTPELFIPDSLAGGQLNLNYDYGAHSTAKFVTADQGIWDDEFQFSYSWRTGTLTVELTGAGWDSTIVLIPNHPTLDMFFWPGWRGGTFQEVFRPNNGASETAAGSYFVQ